MKPNELRIGNWILTSLPGGNKGIMIPSVQTQVQGITLFKEVIVCHTPQIDGFSMSIKHTMGIPITEEWLLKFGFIKQPDVEYNDYWKGGKFPSGKSSSFLLRESHSTANGYFLLEYKDVQTPIKHVHQLQNLYFSLTGQELNYLRN